MTLKQCVILITNFNSIKVRLEQAAGLNPYLMMKFQFHKGTIRTWIRRERKIGRQFQIHKGTIRTLAE